MKKYYEDVWIEIVVFEQGDIVRTSTMNDQQSGGDGNDDLIIDGDDIFG